MLVQPKVNSYEGIPNVKIHFLFLNDVMLMATKTSVSCSNAKCQGRHLAQKVSNTMDSKHSPFSFFLQMQLNNNNFIQI